MSTGASSDTLLLTGASLNLSITPTGEYGEHPQQIITLTLQTCHSASRELCIVKRSAEGLLVIGKATASTQSPDVWGSMLLS